MLYKKYTPFAILIILFSTVFSSACLKHKARINTDEIAIHSAFKRFDVDLFKEPQPIDISGVWSLRKKYGEFFELYCTKIIRIPAENDSVIAANLDLFTRDKDVVGIKKKSSEKYNETGKLESDLMEMLKYYHYYFPSKPVPDIVTYISAFNYTVITTDSVLGIGLDMYLGKDCEFYPALGLPKYMTDKLSEEYILRDAIKAIFQSEYDPDHVSSEFISQIIYQGKLLYFTDLLAPETEDTLKVGYSEQQLKWCRQNESNIWGFMIENNLLFSKEVSRYIRYINDGNTTQGLPKESPAKLGAWIGWQIVRAYMTKHSETNIDKFLNEKDAQRILSESGYKPGK